MTAGLPRRTRLLTALLAVGVMLATVGGAGAWALLRCDRSQFAARSTASWRNERDRYLFACGEVWHTLDGGQTWTRLAGRGLPVLAREGRLGVDRTPGRLYLGLVLSGRSSLRCLLCAWTQSTPAIFRSEDGGLHWQLVHRFTPGPAGSTFRGVHADPDFAGSAWVILVRGSEVAYYATNSGGSVWRKTCTETYSGQCDPPDAFLSRYDLWDDPHDERP
jgi:hypothetical protein